MLAKVYGSTLHGVEAFRITIEVNVDKGLGYFITGQPDDAVKESLSRIEVAIKGLGFHMPRTKLSVNLSPVHIRKVGAGFDLPIALGILMATCQIPHVGKWTDWTWVGELGLDGSVYPVQGVLCMAYQARMEGASGMVVPQANSREASLVKGLTVYALSNLKEALEFIQGRPCLEVASSNEVESSSTFDEGLPDFKEVRGQVNVKRALEIAAAGGHNSLLIGPPGVGKTMLARRLPSILPAMTPEEMLETTRIYSVCQSAQGLITQRPFRSPHHSASDVALAGGGSFPMPGEISLAHNGVLFLDELYEFSRSAVEVLRQPLEDGKVRISRAKLSLEYPASFMLVAAMNPCYCGYFGHPLRRCTCSARSLQNYHRRAASPLLERIDLHVQAESVPMAALMQFHPEGESSAVIRERVIRARAIQTRRYSNIPGVHCNAWMPEREMEGFCLIEKVARKFLLNRIDLLQLSARSYTRILKVGRTIADLAGSATVELEHVAEAIHFRSLDRPLELVRKK